MKYQNKILSASLPIIFVIIMLFCPLFDAKTASFIDLLFNFNIQYLEVILLFGFGIISFLIGTFLTLIKSKYSLIFAIASFVLLILSSTSNPSLKAGVGLLLLICSSGFITIYSYYQYIYEFSFSIKDIAEIALYIGAAVLLDSFLKIRIMGNGGSISIAMVPLFLLALRKGFVKGFIGCGLIYGAINCMIDGYGLMFYPLDYLMAFGSLAIVGLFRPLIINKERRLTIKGVIFLILALVLSCVSRLYFATVSGVKMWGMPTYLESLIYNLTYLLPSIGIDIALLVALYKPLLSIEKKFASK